MRSKDEDGRKDGKGHGQGTPAILLDDPETCRDQYKQGGRDRHQWNTRITQLNTFQK